MAPQNRDVQPSANQTDATHQGDQHPITDASSVFITQLQDDSRAQRTRDVSRVSDQSLSSVKPDQTAVYPNKLIAEAQSAGREISTILQAGHKETDVIQYKDANGQIRETTVAERVESLRVLINQDCQNAITASNELVKNNPNLEQNLNAATAKLHDAATKLGIDPNSADFAQKAANNPELRQLAQDQAVLQSARMAPGTAMLTYAMLKAEGLTDNPMASMEAYKTTGVPKPSEKELADAFLLTAQAGRTNQEVFNSPLYASVNDAVKTDYAVTQNEKGQNILRMLKDADALAQSGDTAKAEQRYKEAWQLGESIDQKFLAAQLKLQDNQSNPQVAQALVGIMADVKEARMHYANFLVKQGKYDDALPIALSVGADTPEFAQADPTYNKLVSDATFGKSMPQGELQAHQAKFAQLMQDTNNPDRFNQAQKELDALQKNFQDTKATLDAGKPKLDAAKAEIDKKLAELEQKKDSTDAEEYKIEQLRLNNEKKTIEAVQKQNEQFEKQGPYLKYLQGVLAYSKEDKDTAHALFEEVKKTDPELAANKDLKIDELLDATKHQNWFQRNWHAIATVGAVVAGVVVGVGVGLLTGPGGIAAGIGTTGAILAAVGGGAVAGGLVFTGTKAAALGTDTVTWKDFREGALIGGASAVPMIRVGAAFAPGAAGLGALEASAATGTSTFAKFGLTRASLGYGAGVAGADQGMQVAFDGKSWKDAGVDFVKEAPFQALTYGTAARATGVAKAVGTDIFFAGGGKAAVEGGMNTYIDLTHHTLNPADANEANTIAQNYNTVNPSLYRPEAAPPQQGGGDQQPAAPRRQLTEQEIERLRNQDITDEPVK
ncbi:MAG: hypothetical protein U0103_20270 [Candidatus Obscuribacterales bacterium]